jgi:hypothetical protein|tara:strand:+ start:222 stop:536 length:315 start_codon:yes stop_codon:yes gene_type:complete
MLDYYGSIIKSEAEIDQELISKFREKCYESYIQKVISDLRKEEILHKEYSVSGWMVFHGKTIHEIIEKTINYQKQKNEKKIKLLYCYNQLFNDQDVCRMICDKI